MRVLLASGEVSGDVAGALLAHSLESLDPGGELVGIGGPRMAAAGVGLLCATDHLGTVGVSEAVAILPGLWRAFRAVRAEVKAAPPDVAVLVGNDVFSVLLGRWLRGRGVPTVSLFPPQVWIWGAVARIAISAFDLVLTCFPQEHDVYARAADGTGTRVHWVGHYLADRLRPRTPPEVAAARRCFGVPDGVAVVALLPGSRRHEMRRLAPVLLGAARRLLEQGLEPRLLLPVAEPGLAELVTAELERLELAARVTLCDNSLEVLRAADVAVLASGTASLEAALLGVPMVVVYRVSGLTRLVVGSAIRLGLMAGETVGLPNLILGRPVVPELTQGRLTTEAVAREVGLLLGEPVRRDEMRQELREVGARLDGGGSLERAAAAVLELATHRARRG